jgi:hypothetical protein
MDFEGITRIQKMEGVVATPDGLEALRIQKIEKPRQKVLLLMILRFSGKVSR